MAPDHTCGGRGAVPCPACTIDGAQARFVKQWRAANPLDTYEPPWLCPICTEAIQVNAGNASEYAHLGAGDLARDEIESHKRWHGESWQAYMALAAPAVSGEG